MKKVRIGKGRVVPLVFAGFGTMVIMAILFILLETTPKPLFFLGAMILSPGIPLLWTSRNIIEIDPEAQTIWEYVWLMGKKTGHPKPYNSIENIFIKKVNMSQRMNARSGHNYTNQFSEYVAFLKYDEDKKLELLREEDDQFVFEEMKKIADKLNTELIDRTSA